MNKKRILFLISKEEEIAHTIKFSNSLKQQFNNTENVALYVKDLTKYEFFLNNVNGFIQSSTTLLIDEYRDIENNLYEIVKEKAKDNFDYIYSIEGETHEVLMEELKAFDAVVVVKNKELTQAMKELLKAHYKPLIILGEEKEYKFDKILMLNDGAYNVNKSVFDFFHLFGEQKIDVLRVNVEDRNRLTERFGDVCNIIDEKTDDVFSVIEKYIQNYDIIIMGQLRYNILFERLTGQIGIKIIENSKNPIFMG